MMDIYGYLNSPDVRDYCRKLGYNFNALESAFIIHSCYRISLEEKFQLFREIMATMPDEAFPKQLRKAKRFLKPETDSFFEVLSQYITEMEKSLESFLKAEPNVFYQYQLFRSNWESPYENEKAYSSFEKVSRSFARSVEGFCMDHEDRKRFIGCVSKVKIDEEEKYDCTAMVMPDGRITAIHDTNHIISEFFSYLWVKIPVPFQRGDLLIGSNPFNVPFDFQCGMIGQEPMVYEKCCCDRFLPNGEEYHGCDTTDMTASGYWLDEQGRIYPECMHYYHELEYYHGEIRPEMRLLSDYGAYLKGEMMKND